MFANLSLVFLYISFR